uniref:DNA2/NAM7 helicase helicase domain-containing protein n=1 Tax=Panagrolaimus superbus TaxID=310955 RepID=A0A914YP57_9BILA
MIYSNYINRSLNCSQIDAVDGLLNQHPRNVFVLFGPPGTGKTYTLVAAIEAIKKAYELKKQVFRFLICAHSNMAADNFAIALMKSGIF